MKKKKKKEATNVSSSSTKATEKEFEKKNDPTIGLLQKPLMIHISPPETYALASVVGVIRAGCGALARRLKFRLRL